MPLPTADEYAAMIDDAAAGGYAIPAVNVTSTLTTACCASTAAWATRRPKTCAVTGSAGRA